MNARIALKDSAHFRAESLRIGGEKLQRERQIDVVNPFTRERVGTVPMASLEDVRRAYEIGHEQKADAEAYRFLYGQTAAHLTGSPR